ncbi:MAG: amidohydrolase, partial [Cytophagaceae bacterium]
MLNQLRARAAALAPELSALRRHLHANPELSFKETQTAAFVTKKLAELGLQPYAVAGTGVVALIEGQPGGPVVALRADMDALPIQELSDVPYKSQSPGVMHACGHDVHTTCLLGAAQLLTEVKGQFKGTVKLIFQPGEELLPGGASLMIQDGVLENPAPTEVIGQHVFPRLPVGQIGLRPGRYMASTEGILGLARRLTICCAATIRWAATSTGSRLSSGMAPWPP